MLDFDKLFGPGDDDTQLTMLNLFLRLCLALVLGAGVAAVYRLTQKKGDANTSTSFIATLVLLSILLAMVTQVIGNSAARAFSLVGILSIVRFRTTVDDTRDTAFVILAVIVGMASGVGNWEAALVGLAVVGLAAVILRYVPMPGYSTRIEWNLVLRVSTGAGGATPWDAVLEKLCERTSLLSTSTARQGAALDLAYHVRLKPGVTPMQLLNEINRIEGIQNVEMKRNQ